MCEKYGYKYFRKVEIILFPGVYFFALAKKTHIMKEHYFDFAKKIYPYFLHMRIIRL